MDKTAKSWSLIIFKTDQLVNFLKAVATFDRMMQIFLSQTVVFCIWFVIINSEYKENFEEDEKAQSPEELWKVQKKTLFNILMIWVIYDQDFGSLSSLFFRRSINKTVISRSPRKGAADKSGVYTPKG